jgi:hypothetical protein
MKKIRLTERELTNIIKRVINEQSSQISDEDTKKKHRLSDWIIKRVQVFYDNPSLTANDVCDNVIEIANKFKSGGGLVQYTIKDGKKY